VNGTALRLLRGARAVSKDDQAAAHTALRSAALAWLHARRALVAAGAELEALERVDAALGAVFRTESARRLIFVRNPHE